MSCNHTQLTLQEYPLLPPRMVFDSEMWHPNGKAGSLADTAELELKPLVYNSSDKKGEVCVSILVNVSLALGRTSS
jgi:hypothetical protein